VTQRRFFSLGLLQHERGMDDSGVLQGCVVRLLTPVRRRWMCRFRCRWECVAGIAFVYADAETRVLPDGLFADRL